MLDFDGIKIYGEREPPADTADVPAEEPVAEAAATDTEAEEVAAEQAPADTADLPTEEPAAETAAAEAEAGEAPAEGAAEDSQA